MIWFAIATTLILSALLGASSPDVARAADPQPGTLDPGLRISNVACYADVTAAESKLAKRIVRCGRLERRLSPATFDANACQKKALRRRIAAAPVSCRRPNPRTTDRYTCSGLACQCVGDEDCNDMFEHANCGDIASCDTTGSEPVCSCLLALD